MSMRVLEEKEKHFSSSNNGEWKNDIEDRLDYLDKMMFDMEKDYKLNRKVMSSIEKQYEEKYEFDIDEFYTDLVGKYGLKFVQLMEYYRLNSISNKLKSYIEKD